MLRLLRSVADKLWTYIGCCCEVILKPFSSIRLVALQFSRFWLTPTLNLLLKQSVWNFWIHARILGATLVVLATKLNQLLKTNLWTIWMRARILGNLSMFWPLGWIRTHVHLSFFLVFRNAPTKSERNTTGYSSRSCPSSTTPSSSSSTTRSSRDSTSPSFRATCPKIRRISKPTHVRPVPQHHEPESKLFFLNPTTKKKLINTLIAENFVFQASLSTLEKKS